MMVDITALIAIALQFMPQKSPKQRKLFDLSWACKSETEM